VGAGKQDKIGHKDRRSSMGHNDYYTEAYKREAAAKAQASGNVSQTARELGVKRAAR
jgi:transposase-like protein